MWSLLLQFEVVLKNTPKMFFRENFIKCYVPKRERDYMIKAKRSQPIEKTILVTGLSMQEKLA